ncbi:MAG: pyruvate kinase [Candidatus Omnitrophota bacterium]|jgi:pyruvate kinase
MVKTKIIATLGPACGNRSVVRQMMLAGLDVVRLNFSHTSEPEVVRLITLIREINKKYRRHIRILGDLEGYRIRLGNLKTPLLIKKGQTVFLTPEKITGEYMVVPFDYEGDLKVIRAGQSIYIDDGTIALEAAGCRGKYLKTKVIAGGTLKSHKGVNIPEAKLEFSGVTQKDKANIALCVQNRFDFIAQSFVRTKDDMVQVRNLVGNKGAGIKFIAKIENRLGIKNIDGIMEASDGIMIARGDLGVSLPIYEVPVWQKELIKKCNRAGKFVITATQMLESMVENHRPTRAEVSDVANAIFDGSDYVMLSAETAIGRYPVQAVEMMNQVISFTERYLNKNRK